MKFREGNDSARLSEQKVRCKKGSRNACGHASLPTQILVYAGAVCAQGRVRYRTADIVDATPHLGRLLVYVTELGRYLYLTLHPLRSESCPFSCFYCIFFFFFYSLLNLIPSRLLSPFPPVAQAPCPPSSIHYFTLPTLFPWFLPTFPSASTSCTRTGKHICLDRKGEKKAFLGAQPPATGEGVCKAQEAKPGN